MPAEHLPPEISAEANTSENTKTQNNKKVEPKAPKQKSARSGFALLLAFISLVIAVGGVYYIWKQFKIAENNIAIQAETIQNLNNTLAENKDALRVQEQLTGHIQNSLQQ